MQLRDLPGTKLVAATLVVLVAGFDAATSYYVVTNGTNLVSLSVVDLVISVVAVLIALGLWKSDSHSRTVRLTFVAAVAFLFLSYFSSAFGDSYTTSVAVLLLFAGLLTLVRGFFIRKEG